KSSMVLQQEGEMAHREAGVPHATGRVHQFMEEAHLNGPPSRSGFLRERGERREERGNHI
ncbi:hypothetical protein KUCAC02_019286, partial [Chaenocephalus aceratus]